MTVFLSVALIICGTQQHANATTISAISYDKSAIESFSVYISKFFEHPNEWSVLDDSGNNISNQYYNENIDLYLHGDFEELLIRTQGVVAVMCATNSSHHSDDIDILRAVTSKGTWETFACYPSGIASVEIEIKMQGNYNVDTVESIITSYGHATVSIASVTGSEYGVGYVINNATILQREISQDGQAVTFVLQFDIDAIIGNGAFYKGTFELSITGGPSGGRAIDCSPSNRQAYPI